MAFLPAIEQCAAHPFLPRLPLPPLHLHRGLKSMRTASPITSLLLVVPLVCWTQLATAEVFKCTGTDGKTSYSESPCTAQGATEVRVPIVASTARVASGPGNSRVAKSAAVSASAASAPQRNAASAPARVAQKASAPAKSDQQIVAECEANHGTNCSSADEIAQRRMDDRTLTADEAAAQVQAVAGRNELAKAKAEADAKAKATANAQTSVSNTTTTPAKKGH